VSNVIAPAIPETDGSLDSTNETVRALKRATESLIDYANGIQNSIDNLTGAISGVSTTRSGGLSAGVTGVVASALSESLRSSILTLINDSNTAEAFLRSQGDAIQRVATDELTNTVQSNKSAADQAFASTAAQITSLNTAVAGNAAAITNEAVVRASADSSLAATLTTVSAASNRQRVFAQNSTPTAVTAGDLWIDTAHGNILKYWDGSQWLAYQDTGISANAAAISNESIARANADSALTTTINSLTSVVNGNTAAITTESATRATADTALSGRIDTLSATVGTNTAAISTESTARAAADSSLSSQITSVSAIANGMSANGKIRFTAVTATGGSAAEFAVNVSADGTNYAYAGFNLQVFSGSPPTSRMTVQASQFVIKSSSGDKVPFFIDSSGNLISQALTAVSSVYGLGNFATLNQITASNITTYIAGAAIGDAVIGTISAGKISAGSLSAISANLGTVTAGYMQSPDGRMVIDLNNGRIVISD
jgi:hypothetical protein